MTAALFEPSIIAAISLPIVDMLIYKLDSRRYRN